MSQIQINMTVAQKFTAIAVMLLLAVGPVLAQSSAEKTATPVKRPNRSTQPLDEQQVMRSTITNDGPFGYNRAGFLGDGNETDGEGDGELDDGPPEMTFSLEWTHCQWHRINPDMPAEATLTGMVSTTIPLVWRLVNGENEDQVLTSLPYIHNLAGNAGDGDNLTLEWDFRLDGGMWSELVPQMDGGFHVPIPAGLHQIELRVSGFLPLSIDEGYYRLTLAHAMIPQL